VFGIVSHAGGSISVDTEVGRGTRFDIYLPCVEGSVELAEATPVAVVGGLETILLVEDDGQVRAVALGILRRHGYTVLEAASPRDALARCAEHEGEIELLLTDVVMPQMSGPELARRLAALRPTMKVLCMSGYTDDSKVRHGIVSANIAYLQKPFTQESLARKVREVLGTRATTA
jgi:two-component system cell cycle sensor histidine kinase/response regulator CckA